VLHASEHRALLLIQHVDEHPCQTESELAEWLDVELDALGPLISAPARTSSKARRACA